MQLAFAAALCRHGDGHQRAWLECLDGLDRHALATLVAGIVGQLNKALDLRILELACRGILLDGGIQLLMKPFLMCVTG